MSATMRGMSTLAASAVLLLKPTAEALSVPENEYIGCFKDSRKDRVMSNILVDDKQMSAAFCRNHCEGKGALFYGTQWSIECWCGISLTENDYERHGTTTCEYTCAGAEDEDCGGFDAFSLYKFDTGSNPDPNPDPNDRTDDDCGAVIIEAEDLPYWGEWGVVNDNDASGGKYLVWSGLGRGQNNRDATDGNIISTTIDIKSAGTYRFKYRMEQPPNVESDKGNDSWLYFPDAARFGPLDKPNQSYGGFTKVFGNALSGFKYSGRADVSHDISEVAVEFAAAGKYEMQIAGRSHGHRIDQLVVYKESLDVEDAVAACS